MVKRVPTPPPPDDEPRYLTVACPFPPYADMEKYAELTSFVRWLACAMKGDHSSLYAVFHKPSAANMVVIEVARAFPHFRSLLGAHYWSQFLLDPKNYSSNVSRIYFSTYPNGRAVEKAGWKRIFVEDVWFEGWHPQNKIIAYPYPISAYCHVPLEDPISVETCRPLSLDMFNMRVSTVPPPPPVPVGSSTWVARKVDSGDKNVEGKDVTLLDHKKSHAPFKPVVSYDDSTKAVTARQASLPPKSSITTSTASGFRSGTPSTERSTATHTSGRAFTVNGGTVFWDYESDGEKESSTAVLSTTDEFEDDHYINIYCKTEPLENQKSAPSFPLSPVHPLLVNRDKPVCPTHGPKCKTSICKDYSWLIRKSKQINEQEKKRREMGNGMGRGQREAEKDVWVGGDHGGNKHKTVARDKYRKANGSIMIHAHSQSSKAASKTAYRIDEESSVNKEDSAYSTTAESLSQVSTPALSTRSVSSARSTSTYTASDASESPTTLSRTLSLSPTNVWAKGNPLTAKRDRPSGESGTNGNIGGAGKLDKAEQLDSLRKNGVTSPVKFATSVVKDAPTNGSSSFRKAHVTANTSLPEGIKGPASVASWAKIASQPPTSSPSPSVGSAPYERKTPHSIGKVITSFDKSGSGSHTIPWEDLMDNEVEEEELW